MFVIHFIYFISYIFVFPRILHVLFSSMCFPSKPQSHFPCFVVNILLYFSLKKIQKPLEKQLNIGLRSMLEVKMNRILKLTCIPSDFLNNVLNTHESYNFFYYYVWHNCWFSLAPYTSSECEQKIRNLLEMGFDEVQHLLSITLTYL